jgi:CheY-like chemotaxis protein
VPAASFRIERLSRLRLAHVDAALTWLAAGAQVAGASINRRALFSCMIERLLPIPPQLVGVRSVLLIDDEPALLRSTSRVLRQAAPELEVTAAEGAAAGLARALTLLPDAVIVDAYMPETCGVELCARLRAGRATEKATLVAMTADPTPELAAAFAKAGAVAFLEKPVDAPALFEALSTHLLPSSGDW